jgi:hypothetical protein
MSHIVIDGNKAHGSKFASSRECCNSLLARKGEQDLTVMLLKSIGKFLLGFLALWTLLYVVGDFSVRQSAALAMFAQCVVHAFWAMVRPPNIVLVPHRILIRPRWDRILLDLELVATFEGYDTLCEPPFGSPAPEPYNVFRDGVCFTVLDSKQFGQRSLIYSDDYHVFVSEVDFERSLVPPLTTSDRPEYPFQKFFPAPVGELWSRRV